MSVSLNDIVRTSVTSIGAAAAAGGTIGNGDLVTATTAAGEGVRRTSCVGGGVEKLPLLLLDPLVPDTTLLELPAGRAT